MKCSTWYPSLRMQLIKQRCVSSTMDAAKKIIQEKYERRNVKRTFGTPALTRRIRKPTDFLCCSSDIQTNGRGTAGSKWISPKGNLYFTIALKELCVKNSTLSNGIRLFSALISLCLVETIKKFLFKFLRVNSSERRRYIKNVQLKWPNDVLYAEKKLAGTLIEQCGEWFFIGIGVNILKTPRVFQKGRVATSFFEVAGSPGYQLSESEMEAFRKAFIKDFARRLRNLIRFPKLGSRYRFKNSQKMLQTYENYLARDVVYHARDGKNKYKPLGIDRQGSLIAFDLNNNTILTLSSTYPY